MEDQVQTRPPYATDRPTLLKEVEVTFFKGSGPGGQHRNKTETGVRLFHRVSGVTVTATERRSQAQNLETAFERLVRRLSELNFVPKKRVKTKATRASKRRRLEAKRKVGEKKRHRGRVADD